MKKRAIVIDDEPGVLQYFKTVLEELGYDVETYISPVMCPLYSREYDCDLLLTDQKMPFMTGVEFIRHLDEKNRSVPRTALMTASWDQELTEKTKELKCEVFMKPLMPRKLSAWLN